MTAPLPLSQNFPTIVSTLNTIFSALSGIPAKLARGAGQPTYYPQMGTGEITDATSTHLDTGTNAEASANWDFVSIVGVGWDEWRKTHDPDAVIEGDTFDPPQGGVVYESCGNREIIIQLKIESFGPFGAFPIAERVRTAFGLPTICNTLNTVGLGRKEIRTALNKDYDDENGRRVNLVVLEFVFNGFDSAKDDPVTTIETLPLDGITA